MVERDQVTPATPEAEASSARPGRVRRWRHRFASASRRERGVVLIWFALMLIVLMGFAGFAVDLSNWWLQAEKLQRAADSGAHAGVVYLPADLDSARSTARAEVAKNGYRTTGASSNASIEVTQEPNPNRLRVAVTTTVDNYFVSLLGVDEVTLTREAVAEYISPVPMGSPQNKLGNDPDGVDPGTELWLNAAGPRTGKQQGERYGTTYCNATPREFGCSGNTSTEYDEGGYVYSVKVKSSPSSQPLRIEVFDAPFVNHGSTCSSNMMNGWEINDVRWRFPDADTVYGNDPERCPGDQAWDDADVETTFSVARPDETPWTDEDNPVLNTSTCKPQTARAYDPGRGRDIRDWLNSGTHGSTDYGDGRINLGEGYRRWFTVCEIPSGQVDDGEYILRVRTNADDDDTEGHNRFSLRAGFGHGGVTAVNGTHVTLHAKGKLPIYANAEGADTRFHLARILPFDAGRTLRINLYDMGESSHPGTLRILAPQEYSGTFSDCSITRDDGAWLNTTPSLCRLNNVSSSSYNGRVLTIDVPIPEDYDCSEGAETGCWVKIQATYPSYATVTDATTWSATILGNPIRLVE